MRQTKFFRKFRLFWIGHRTKFHFSFLTIGVVCALLSTYFAWDEKASVESELRKAPVILLGDKAVISTKRDTIKLVIYKRSEDSVTIKGDIDTIKDTTP